ALVPCALLRCWWCFLFQAEDGIRDFHVTGVQTCALPISIQVPENASPGTVGVVVRSGGWGSEEPTEEERQELPEEGISNLSALKIGRASCRERAERKEGGAGKRDAAAKRIARRRRSRTQR